MAKRALPASVRKSLDPAASLRSSSRAFVDYRAQTFKPRAPRDPAVVIDELRRIYARGSEFWPTFEGKHYQPPMRVYTDLPCTPDVQAVYMTNWSLINEAKRALEWLLVNEPPASEPSKRAKWVVDVYRWAAIGVYATNLQFMFWNVADRGTVPIRDRAWCTEDQISVGIFECPAEYPPKDRKPYFQIVCPPTPSEIVQLDFAHEVIDAIRRAGGEWVFFSRRDYFHSQLLGLLTFTPARWATEGTQADWEGRFWLELDFGPSYGKWGDLIPIPREALAAAFKGKDDKEAFDRTYKNWPIERQLETIFRVHGPHGPHPIRGVAVPIRGGWTVFTPDGIMEQTRRVARWFIGVDVADQLRRAALFYSANHLPFFAARGELGLSVEQLEEAFKNVKREGSRTVTAVLSAVAGVIGAVNWIAGIVASVVVAAYSIIAEITGDAFPMSIDVHVVQPLFFRMLNTECTDSITGASSESQKKPSLLSMLSRKESSELIRKALPSSSQQKPSQQQQQQQQQEPQGPRLLSLPRTNKKKSKISWGTLAWVGGATLLGALVIRKVRR